jgi:DNA polymerase bacteriophage-type
VELTPAVLERVTAYCRNDVRDLVGIYDAELCEWEGLDLDGYEEVQRRMNDRGILLDVDLMRRLLVLDDVLCERALKVVRLDRIEVSAPKRFRKHLSAALGYDPGGSSKEVLAEVIAEKPGAAVMRLIEARQAVSSIARGKLRAGLEMRTRDDDRLRDNLRYYGAHTGRDSGQGMQLHNLTKGPPLELAESIAAVFEDEPHRVEVLHAANKKKGLAATWKRLDAASINTLVRACLIADEGHTLLICDWSQIEGRKLAWAADEKEALKLYRRLDAGDKDADPYRVMAAKLWGIPPSEVDDKQRQLGKVAILGCGYQMGADKFHDTAEVQGGIDWGEYELTAKDVVTAWRKAHENIVSFWYETQEAAITVTEARGDREVRVGPYTWAKHDGLVFNVLPSGRVIVYRGMRTHLEKGKWGKDRVSLSYQGRKGREYTYGGKLVENETQASCGCIMRVAVVAADRAGLLPMLTVHDELIGQAKQERAKEAFEQLRRIMTTTPAWCAGMPLAAEGFTSDRYKKG